MRNAALGLAAAGLMAAATPARELTYDAAMEIALRRSSRVEIIRGNLEVAERKYQAEKVNFLLPEISLNGTLPGYSSAEQYTYPDGFGGTKQVGLRKSLDMNTFIGLNQNLITGGSLDIRAYLQGNERHFPQTLRLETGEGVFTANESERTGRFSFALQQPLLQPSEAKFTLNNRKDELSLARLGRQEETATLKQEVAQAYIGALQLQIDKQIAEEKLRSARLKADIDSVKLQDGILSEEQWLETSSARLDAELAVYDVESNLAKQMQTLAVLLDMEEYQDLELAAPPVEAPLTPEEQERLLAAADRSVPIQRAEFDYAKAKRAADYSNASSGIRGTLTASYEKDAGDIETTYDGLPQTETSTLNLDTWEVKLEFSYPLWDGGSGSAESRASELEAQKAKIELERQRKIVRADIRNLTEGLDVSHRKLSILQKQVDLTAERLGIARMRFENGEISEVEYIESNVAHLDARKKYLEELQKYLVDRYTLEGKFTG